MHGEELRKSALLARSLARTMIINPQVCPRSLKFRKNIDGKPENPTIKHNIMSFARRYFTEHEVQVLAAISDPQGIFSRTFQNFYY
ncbi:hypothetical protein ACJIZ3_020039 [Penstemon smallii]|uniref:Uncharacterized protein n=1 Tax=Penstemon smallii TaxID=265156 RepID=A0ABD3SHR9_9LAMI